MQRPISFLVVFVLFFLAILAFLGYMDVLPEPSKNTANGAQASITVKTTKPAAQAASTKSENPVRITVEKLGLDVTIKNPSSTKVAVLDEALLTGAVRYPTSAHLGEAGTVLLFGHSSYLPVVYNQAYKAFKGIHTLESGDIIIVYSDTLEYHYSVTKVSVANADEDVVELRQDGKYLTLVTCDSFATKSSRFIVTSKFVGAYPLTSN